MSLFSFSNEKNKENLKTKFGIYKTERLNEKWQKLQTIKV